jgi:GDP-L-fucose synthase
MISEQQKKAFRGRKVLVTGGTGTIGPALVKELLDAGADVTVASIDTVERAQSVLGDLSIFQHADLRDYETCLRLAKGQDYIFHLMGVKGSSQIGDSRLVSTFVPVLLCNTQMMEAAFQQGVQKYLFVGSIGQYPPLDIREEDDVWNGAPVGNDRYMGIAKRTGEAQAETYYYQHGWAAVKIVRLANVYGPFDDFDPQTGQVIPALIRRMSDGEDPIKVAGDGTAVRDFIYSQDVVDGMLLAVENAPPCYPINLGSGVGSTIKEVAETIAGLVPTRPVIEWDITRPTGDQMRVLATQRAKETLGFEPSVRLSEGIKRTVQWYLEHVELAQSRSAEPLSGGAR